MVRKTSNYPNSTNILDYYHAVEYLHGFAKVVFGKKHQESRRKKWVDQQKAFLLNDQVKYCIEQIREVKVTTKTQREAQAKILTYYTNNKYRMYYKTYKDRELLIGSGPIESAHRFVLQKRMKQSGQKWTKKGGQNVTNLRVAYLNQQWTTVVDLIKDKTKMVA